MRENDPRTLKVEALNERRKQVARCLKKGMRQNAVAKLCGMSEGTVGKIRKLYEKGGIKAVTIVKDGRPKGSGRSLGSEQEKEIQRLLVDRTPDRLKLSYALWGRQAVGELIGKRFGIALSARSVGDYPERWGYTPQKPLQRAYGQRPEAVRKWPEEDYPQIGELAKQENADIHWGDEMGLRSDDVRGRSYAPRGRTPVIRAGQRRDGFSLISTVTDKGSMRWMAFEGAYERHHLEKVPLPSDKGCRQEGIPHS